MATTSNNTLEILKANVVLYARRFMLGTATQAELFEQVEGLNAHLRWRKAQRRGPDMGDMGGEMGGNRWKAKHDARNDVLRVYRTDRHKDASNVAVCISATIGIWIFLDDQTGNITGIECLSLARLSEHALQIRGEWAPPEGRP